MLRSNKNYKINQIPKMVVRLSLLLFLGLCFLPNVTFAKGLIDCRYLKAQGQNIKLEIKVHSPPPTSLIVIQKLPSGISIEQASPAVKKFSHKRSEAKWLFKGIKPGTIILAMKLNKPIGAGAIRGEIRYMDPTTGAMVKMPIFP